jgi:uncharacterized membrane protein YkvI
MASLECSLYLRFRVSATHPEVQAIADSVFEVYRKLGIDWASSLLGFIALALLPVPWVLFKYGSRIRAKSKYETVQFS